MKRVYISYAGIDGEAAKYITSQLRAVGADVFQDVDRILAAGNFSRRLVNEMRTRRCIIFIQTPDALKNDLVQAELDYAYRQRLEIIPLALKPINVRETGEYRFLLNLKALDFSAFLTSYQAKPMIDELVRRLRQAEDLPRITLDNVSGLKPFTTLQGHTSWVREVTFSPDGALMASCSNDKTVCLWDMRASDRTGGIPPLLARIAAHDQLVWALEFAPRHALLASAGGDNTIRFWDLNSLPNPYEFTCLTDHKHPVYGLAWSQDGKMLASASHDDTVRVRDVRNIDVTGQPSNAVSLMHGSHVYWVTFSLDNRWLATCSRDSAVRVWEVDADNLTQLNKAKPRFFSKHTSWVNSVTFSPNNLLMASAGHDNRIYLWDVIHGDVIGELTGHTDSVNDLDFSEDGNLLASAAKDDTVRLWDVNRLREVMTISGHERGVNSVSFSPDGEKLATGSGDTTIKIWKVVTKF